MIQALEYAIWGWMALCVAGMPFIPWMLRRGVWVDKNGYPIKCKVIPIRDHQHRRKVA
jgi:hypothetical protein